MTTMPTNLNSETLTLLQSTLQECRTLYISSGQLCAQQYPNLISQSGAEFVQLMDDLHKALVLKIYVLVCEADKQWSHAEREMAEVLFEHLWHRRLTGDNLVAAARKAADESSKLQWYSIIRPFDRIVPLRERVARSKQSSCGWRISLAGPMASSANRKRPSFGRFATNCSTTSGPYLSMNLQRTRNHTRKPARQSPRCSATLATCMPRLE